MLTSEGEDRRVEPQVNALLKLLVEHAGTTLSRDTINAHIWSDRVVGDDALRATIRKLRDALGDSAKAPRYIRTDPLKGYTLIASVSTKRAATQESTLLQRYRWPFAFAGLAVLAGVVTLAAFTFAAHTDSPPKIELLTRMSGSEVSPDYSPAGNRLVFSHRANKDDYLQLYVKDLQTRQVQRLTWEPVDYASALWSPDGKQIVYSRSSGEELQHFLAAFDPDQGIVHEQPLLVDADNKRYLLAWSRDGKCIYFKDNADPALPFGISKLDLDSGKLITVTAPSVRGRGDFFARESASGKMLALLREVERGKQELLIMDIGTGSLLHTRILLQPADRFAWADDDASLVLSNFSGEMQEFDLQSNQLTIRTALDGGINDIFFHCGDQCLFMRQHNGNFLDLQEQPNPFEHRPLMASRILDLPGAEDFPVFHRDEAGIYFVARDNTGTSVRYMDKLGEARVLFNLPAGAELGSLQLDAKGEHLAGLLEGRVFLFNLARGEFVYLTSGADLAGFPHWSRDGSGLMFSKTERGNPTIYRYSLASDTLEPVVQDYIAIVEIDPENCIQVDARNNAWLVTRNKHPELLATITSTSPNRWQVRGDWLYFTVHEGNLAVMQRVNFKTGSRERRELARNRFRLNFDLNAHGDRALFVKSLLAESNLVKVTW
ncbi:winged helix-turn-helix domain-containing protein [Microbulbifer pacificus]|uniref:Winged helix-turn-helix domain-containing protein n=1 Tax=Microbulbifer pacificus TaxID=407164 RepID=A0AAU0MTT4_9GAMM|nr:winged helix-turn-helix domain-containing protein [Microbulbifer pacificus]WOX03892.1 winged helix-turn-helix domain-containing protein [Microbulbifer pacificus]